MKFQVSNNKLLDTSSKFHHSLTLLDSHLKLIDLKINSTDSNLYLSRTMIATSMISEDKYKPSNNKITVLKGKFNLSILANSTENGNLIILKEKFKD